MSCHAFKHQRYFNLLTSELSSYFGFMVALYGIDIGLHLSVA